MWRHTVLEKERSVTSPNITTYIRRRNRSFFFKYCVAAAAPSMFNGGLMPPVSRRVALRRTLRLGITVAFLRPNLRLTFKILSAHGHGLHSPKANISM